MKKMKLAMYIFILVGALSLAASFYFYVDAKSFLKSSLIADGVVVNLERRTSSQSRDIYYPIVSYRNPDGNEYKFEGKTGSNPPSYNPGEEVKVLFNPENPYDARISSFMDLWGPPVIIGSIGIILFCVGVIVLFRGRLRKKEIEKLKQLGHKVSAKITEVYLDTSVKFNNQSPYRIIAQWLNPATNELLIFKSESIWFNPQEFIKSENIEVYIDPPNPKKYYVDISFLPKASN